MGFFKAFGHLTGRTEKSVLPTTVTTKAATLSDPDILAIFGGTPTISGRIIDASSAMKAPAVRQAVTLLSESVGAIPFKLYSRDGSAKQPAPDHPGYTLAHDFPNDDQSAEEFRAALTRDALLHDRGYAFINRIDGRPVELNRLDPSRVTARQTTAGETVFDYTEGKTRRTFQRHEILLINCPGGCSPIKDAREAIALALELEACAARIFSKGGRPSGALEFPNTLGDDAAKRMAAAWRSAHSGENSGGTAILEEGGKFTPFTFDSVDSQFHEMRLLQTVEIARAFNVPPTMLMDLSHGTFSNTEQLDLYFRTYSLRPWLIAWARAYERALILPTERGLFFVEPVFDALAAADTASRTDAIAKQIAARVLTPNEARALINLPPHPDGDDLVNPYTTTSTAPANPSESE